MTEKQQLDYIIHHLGLMGATHTLRVPKLRLLRLIDGKDSFTLNVRKYSLRTIHQIDLILTNQTANRNVTYLYDLKNTKPNWSIK